MLMRDIPLGYSNLDTYFNLFISVTAIFNWITYILEKGGINMNYGFLWQMGVAAKYGEVGDCHDSIEWNVCGCNF